VCRQGERAARAATASGRGRPCYAAAVRGDTVRLYTALLIATFFWGSLPIASKAIIAEVGPLQQSLVRGVTAFIVLTGFALATGGPRIVTDVLRYPRVFVVQGFLGFFASSVTSLLTLNYATASLQTVLVGTYPVMLALMTRGSERISRQVMGGTTIALLGVVVVVAGDDPGRVFSGGVDPRGVALGLLTAFIIAASQMLARQSMVSGVHPVGLTSMAAAASVPMLLVVAWTFGAPDEIVRASPSALIGLGYLGLFCTSINFALWYWGLKYISAARAASIQYLTTPLGVFLAWLILGEPLTLEIVGGAGLVVGGVVISQMPPRAAFRIPAR